MMKHKIIAKTAENLADNRTAIGNALRWKHINTKFL